jgi:hypothetical protein
MILTFCKVKIKIAQISAYPREKGKRQIWTKTDYMDENQIDCSYEVIAEVLIVPVPLPVPDCPFFMNGPESIMPIPLLEKGQSGTGRGTGTGTIAINSYSPFTSIFVHCSSKLMQ